MSSAPAGIKDKSSLVSCLEKSPLLVLGRLAYSSNSTMLVDLLDTPEGLKLPRPGKSADDDDGAGAANDGGSDGGGSDGGGSAESKETSKTLLDSLSRNQKAVYKPISGERPLHDFPPDLSRRERAAYLVSELLGWGFVPPTVIRDGPYGQGSLQLFMDCDFAEHYFTLKDREEFLPVLQRLCVFDLIINSTDRKSGHVLLGKDGSVWAIDNGLSFHSQSKLRTVIWDFGGREIPDEILGEVSAFVQKTASLGEITSLLSEPEIAALLGRTQAILKSGVFPLDSDGFGWPWPMV